MSQIFVCPAPPRRLLPLTTDLDVGFGATVLEHRVSRAQRWTRCWYYIRTYDDEKPSPTLRKIENRAEREGGYWRLTFKGPMATDVYERVAPKQWAHVERRDGFA